jgi:N-acyl-D-amino-acid deacylase
VVTLKTGIKDRGRLKEGAFADVTIFDQDRVIDRATFENPHQFPVGIEYVIVNGHRPLGAAHGGACRAGSLMGRESGASSSRRPTPGPEER